MNKYIDNSNIRELLDSKIREFSNGNRSRSRAVIFWYDEKKEFENFIEDKEVIYEKIVDDYITIGMTSLFDNTIFIIYENNSFRIRYFIENEELNNNIILYIPFKRPKDDDNSLLDIESQYQDALFIPNATTIRMKDLELSEEFRDKVLEYDSFFKNKKRLAQFNTFKEKSSIEITVNNFDRIIICVLLGIVDFTDEGIIKEIFYLYYEDKESYEELFKWGSKKYVSELMSNYFGFKLDEKHDMQLLIQSIIMTVFTTSLQNISKMDAFGRYILRDGIGNSSLFIDSLKRDKKRDYIFNKMSEDTYRALNLEGFIEKLEIFDIIKSDLFVYIDSRIVQYVKENIFDKNIDSEKMKSMIYDRKFSYFYNDYKNEYEFLLNIIKCNQSIEKEMNNIKSYEFDSCFKHYIEETYIVDSYYRKCNYYCDKIEIKQEYKDILSRIEDRYVNDYLSKLTSDSQSSFNNMRDYRINGICSEQEFYKSKIEKFEEKKERVIVIISDGLRYEVAQELKELLIDTGAKVTIESMLGVVPSYTKLGMASLLPHESLTMNDNNNNESDIMVDGINQSGTENRKRILKKYNENNTCLTYDELMAMGKADWKNEFSGKKIVYIYHDIIDKTGESNPNNMFKACDECIKELIDLIKQLDTTFSGVQIFVTADHGFLYKRGKIEAHEKTPKDIEATIIKTRYSFKKKYDSEPIHMNEETIDISLDYIFGNENQYIVSIPKGINTYVRQGTGFNYVHGGLLPQEVAVPLINYKSLRKKESLDEVGISLSSLSNKITSNVSYLEFVQNQNVDETHRACRYRLRFEDETGKQVSTETEIIAEFKNTEVEKRKFKEKFTFKDEKFDSLKPYYLVIYNDKDIMIEKIKFYIDIIIPNYFE